MWNSTRKCTNLDCEWNFNRLFHLSTATRWQILLSFSSAKAYKHLAINVSIWHVCSGDRAKQWSHQDILARGENFIASVLKAFKLKLFLSQRSGSPIPIEYLPAENSMSSKVRLMILYQGRPTTTIAVGDPLTFRLESQDGYNHINDIFATNVVARDPYSGRSVQLIDRYGLVNCL